MKSKLGCLISLGAILGTALALRNTEPHSDTSGEWLSASRDVATPVVKSSALAMEDAGRAPAVVANYGKLRLAFEANQGQTDPRVKFLSRSPGYNLFLTGTEVVLSLPAGDLMQQGAASTGRTPAELVEAADHGNKRFGRQQGLQEADVMATRLQTRMVHANPEARVVGFEQLPGKVNYFIGNDPRRWRTNVPTYARVRYENIYPGVDLVYYGNQQQLEYDFIVAPGADPKRIEMALRGAGTPKLDRDGNLVLRTLGGEVEFHKPVVYQEFGTERREIAAKYVLDGGNRVRFRVVGTYDATKPLVIDPVLSYSTYLGGSNGATANSIAVDSAGNVYVTGGTASTDFPTKNPAQSASGGSTDVFVSKFDPTGSSLVYSTYLGGAGTDISNSIAVDSSGNVYVTGLTQSLNFPTKNPIQATLAGGSDAFVTKLDSTGSVLVYSTYLGGNGDDLGNGIGVDASGNAYVGGKTGSINFPTKNPLQSAAGGGDDAFVAKLDLSGSTLIYSTYLGGSFSDEANGIAVDASGDVYVAGDTSSTNFPVKNPFQATRNGSTNAFVTKIDPTGSALVYSTYLGGSSFDEARGIAVDASGNASVTGSTLSADFPTKNPFQAMLKGSFGNAFVTKFDPTGSALLFSTYLGGTGNGGDPGEGIAVDSTGNVYVTGVTSSSDFPLSKPIEGSPLVLQSCGGGYYGPYSCGNTAFVTELNDAGSALVFSTYLGAVGGNFEDGQGIAVDAAGDVFVTGFTPGTNLLVTPGAFQLAGGTSQDAFVAKISPADAPGFSLPSFSLNFPDEGVGGTSQSIPLVVVDTGSATLNITSIVPSGDFTVAGNGTCGSSLAGGTSCTVAVIFAPTAAGVRTGSITFTDNAGSSPQTVTLSGSGISGLSATLSPSSLNFNSQTVGTTGAAQTVSLTNTGSATLTINGVSLSGANPTSFTISANSSCGGSLVVGASCAVGVAFVPTAVGNLSAALEIFDNSAQSPRTVALTGVGFAPPTVTLSPTSLSFPAQVTGSTSPAQTVTLATSGSGTLAISSINASSNFNASSNCDVSVMGGGSCTITVTFTPTATGNLSGNLVIVDNASDSPQMVSLSGLGTDFSISPASGSPSSATVTAGNPATYTVSVAGTLGFSGTVSLSCSSPAGQSKCSVPPSPLMVSGTTPANATVTVTTAARSAAPPRWHPQAPPGLRIVLPSLLLFLSLVVLAAALRRFSIAQRTAWLELAVVLLTVVLFFGCGGSSGPQNTFTPQGTLPGTYQIPVSATSAGVTRTTTLILNVQ